MQQRKKSSRKSAKKGFVIGLAGFAKISAVEGIRLTPAMKKRTSKARREKLTSEEHRAAIIRAYRKA
jgi:hypothetical protein